MVLFGLPQIDMQRIINSLKDSYNIEADSVDEIKTSKTTPDDALYLVTFNKNKAPKKLIYKVREIEKYWFHLSHIDQRRQVPPNVRDVECSVTVQKIAKESLFVYYVVALIMIRNPANYKINQQVM